MMLPHLREEPSPWDIIRRIMCRLAIVRRLRALYTEITIPEAVFAEVT